MHREIDSRLAITALAILVVFVGAFAWWRFASPSGALTASQAGLGRPMHPGEVAGGRAAVRAPALDPSSNR